MPIHNKSRKFNFLTLLLLPGINGFMKHVPIVIYKQQMHFKLVKHALPLLFNTFSIEMQKNIAYFDGYF